MRKALIIAGLSTPILIAGCAAFDPHQLALNQANDLCTSVGVVPDDPRRANCLLSAYSAERERAAAMQRTGLAGLAMMNAGQFQQPQRFQTRCTSLGFTTTCN